ARLFREYFCVGSEVVRVRWKRIVDGRRLHKGQGIVWKIGKSKPVGQTQSLGKIPDGRLGACFNIGDKYCVGLVGWHASDELVCSRSNRGGEMEKNKNVIDDLNKALSLEWAGT